MEEEGVKNTMYCATCNKKVEVLEGEVTCPDCGALLEAPEHEEKSEEEEEVLGVEVEEEDDELSDEGDIK